MSADTVSVVPVAEVLTPLPPLIVNVSPIVAAALPESVVSVISLAVTFPELIAKCVLLNFAIPLLVAVAFSPLTVTVTSLPTLATTVLIPSPP